MFCSIPPHLLTLIHSQNQGTTDYQLLETASDYFHFVQNFFEVIRVSATHIYHSALELSPLSSIIRKVYYHQRLNPLPKAIIRIKDLWGAIRVISSNQPHYLSFTCSPRDEYIVGLAEAVIEIWNATTLTLFSTLHLTKVAAKFRQGLAYSHGGVFLASCFSDGIIIWDVKTGGELTTIGCEVTDSGLELEWLDIGTICTISPLVKETIVVNIYSIASGTRISTTALQSRYKPCVWAEDKSLRVATMTQCYGGQSIDIFKVGSTTTLVESFPFHYDAPLQAFSPVTHRAAILMTGHSPHNSKLLIINIRALDNRDLRVLLSAIGSFQYTSFSFKADVFAASTKDQLLIWKSNISGMYTLDRVYQHIPGPLKFPQSYGDLHSCAGAQIYTVNCLNQIGLMESGTIGHHQYCDAFSLHGTFTAIACLGGFAITITNLSSQNPIPSQIIYTDLDISAMVLTGNVLLAADSEKVIGWLLTEEGVVHGVIGNTRADYRNSLWEISGSLGAATVQQDNGERGLQFSVKDQIAVIYMDGSIIHAYCTRTGEIIKPAETPQHNGCTHYCLYGTQSGNDWNHYHHDLYKNQKRPLELGWPISETTLKEGWVKDPEGKHRMWLPAHWRIPGNEVDWFHNTKTLRLRNSSQTLIVKF